MNLKGLKSSSGPSSKLNLNKTSLSNQNMQKLQIQIQKSMNKKNGRSPKKSPLSKDMINIIIKNGVEQMNQKDRNSLVDLPDKSQSVMEKRVFQNLI
jgi:hypothetical protein